MIPFQRRDLQTGHKPTSRRYCSSHWQRFLPYFLRFPLIKETKKGCTSTGLQTFSNCDNIPLQEEK
jgi:hypothetical protein